MESFLFGPGERLFGAYYEGLGPATAPAVLICNGLGQDYSRSHFVLRHLARRLSAVGGPVLQFDYRGTGDSWGDPEHNTLAELREDVTTAREELREISARPRIVLLGVRLGAWLALEQGDRVIAWDPLLSGRGHVAALHALADALRQASDGQAEGTSGAAQAAPELAGYRYHERLLAEIEALDLAQIVGQKHFDRLALISGDDAERDAAGRILSARCDALLRHASMPPHWDTVPQLERSLTPFASLAELCEAVSRW